MDFITLTQTGDQYQLQTLWLRNVLELIPRCLRISGFNTARGMRKQSAALTS